MRYYPTLRSSTSNIGADKHGGMSYNENDNSRPFGIRPDIVKTSSQQAPSFYQPQNEVGRYDAAFGGGSFRSMNQDFSSSEDGENIEKKLQQKKQRGRVRSNSSGYSHSSEDGLVKKPTMPRRSDSQDQILKIVQNNKVKMNNRSMSFGGSDGSVQLSTSDKGLGSDHGNLLANPKKSPSVGNKRSKNQKNEQVPLKQSSLLFDSVRNVVNEVGKDLN